MSGAFPDVNAKDVIVNKLVPYSSIEVDYMITVAEVYFDTKKIADLQNYVLDSSSDIFNSNNSAVNTLSSLIDPKIPIDGLIDSLNRAAFSSSNSQSSSGNGESQDDIFQSLGSMDSHALRASTIPTVKRKDKKYIIGIVIGCVAGVGIYIGAIIYLLKRRFKKSSNTDVQNNEDTSSFSDSSEFYDEEKYQMKLEYTNSVGDVRLSDSESQDAKYNTKSSNPLSMIFNVIKTRDDTPRHIPEISAPINVKSSLGW